eukprot:2006056-Pleurochrysis_carterae.AAC.1
MRLSYAWVAPAMCLSNAEAVLRLHKLSVARDKPEGCVLAESTFGSSSVSGLGEGSLLHGGGGRWSEKRPRSTRSTKGAHRNRTDTFQVSIMRGGHGSGPQVDHALQIARLMTRREGRAAVAAFANNIRCAFLCGGGADAVCPPCIVARPRTSSIRISMLACRISSCSIRCFIFSRCTSAARSLIICARRIRAHALVSMQTVRESGSGHAVRAALCAVARSELNTPAREANRDQTSLSEYL